MILRAGYTGRVSPSGTRGNGDLTSRGWTVSSEDPVDALIQMRNGGMSVRQIAYLTGKSKSTIGDAIKRRHDSLPDAMPYYKLVDY